MKFNFFSSFSLTRRFFWRRFHWFWVSKRITCMRVYVIVNHRKVNILQFFLAYFYVFFSTCFLLRFLLVTPFIWCYRQLLCHAFLLLFELLLVCIWEIYPHFYWHTWERNTKRNRRLKKMYDHASGINIHTFLLCSFIWCNSHSLASTLLFDRSVFCRALFFRTCSLAQHSFSYR